jgi:hypothetical protein
LHSQLLHFQQAFIEGKFDECIELMSGQNNGDDLDGKRETLNKATVRAAKSDWKVAEQYSNSILSLFPQVRFRCTLCEMP